MQREILRTVLERVPGVRRDGDVFQSEEGRELTLYLGEPGRAMVVGHVQSVAVLELHLEVKARDRGTLYVQADAVHAVQAAESHAKGPKRSGVGFAP